MNTFSNEVLGPADYNQAFVDALENLDQVIQQRKTTKQSLWRNMFVNEPYVLGEGLVKKAFVFHGGKGDQSGLDKWRPIQVTNLSSNPIIDGCGSNPSTVEYGFETVEYTGFQTERRTPHICLDDIKFLWQFQQQLELIYSFLGDITNDVWENYAREQYINMACEAGRSFVFSNGTYNTHTFTYNPFSRDADGDNVLTVATDIPISTFNWTYLQKYWEELSIACPMGAIGTDGTGLSLFGLCMGAMDFSDYITRDEKISANFQWYSPVVLIENFGYVKTYKGYSIMNDMYAPRYVIKTLGATTITMRRVEPFLKVTTGMLTGSKNIVNPEYLTAEYAMLLIFLQDVFKIQVPPAGPARPGGGTEFGDQPSYYGEFLWKNIENETYNIKRNIGFYYANFEAFAKPLENMDYAIAALYKRCTNITPSICGMNATGSAVASSALASDAVAVTGNIYQMSVTTAAIIDAETPSAIYIDSDGGGTTNKITGIIADSSAAPTYILQFASAPTVATYTHSGGAKLYVG